MTAGELAPDGTDSACGVPAVGPGVPAVRRQARACAELGSPLYAALLDRAADDLAGGGVVADVLGDRAGAPPDDLVALRLLGGVHRLVLQRRAGALALWYPSVGGRFDGSPGQVDGLWAAFAETCAMHLEELMAALDTPPQTNEVGRSAGLAGALRHLVTVVDLPVRLAELGASAGLNLRPDAVLVTAAGGADASGPTGSPVRLTGAWAGRAPGRDGTTARVVGRTGCDPRPLDPLSTTDRLTLTGYTWPDQLARLERLRGAFALAAADPVAVDRADAATWLSGLSPRAGHWTVVWHSVMWQYLGPAERAGTRAGLEWLGGQATPTAPVAEVSFEPEDGGEFVVRATRWTGGDPVSDRLGTAPAHGLPVTWSVRAARDDAELRTTGPTAPYSP